MVDPFDEYCVQQLKELDGKKLISIAGLRFNTSKSDDEQISLKEYETSKYISKYFIWILTAKSQKFKMEVEQ